MSNRNLVYAGSADGRNFDNELQLSLVRVAVNLYAEYHIELSLVAMAITEAFI